MQNVTKGIVLMAMSSIAFCVMACLVKAVSASNIYTTTLVRFLIGIVIVIGLSVFGFSKLTNIDKRGLFMRGILGGIAVLIGFISITKLGIIKASILSNTYPIFATILGVILLKESISLLKIIAIVVAFSGLVLTVTSSSHAGSAIFQVGFFELLSIAGAVMGGFAVIYIKKLRETESSLSIFLAQCVFGLLLVALPSGKGIETLSIAVIVLMVLMGVFASLGQLLLTEGYKFITVGTGSVFAMASPVLNLIAGVLFFHETMNLQTGMGASIVILSSIILILPIRYFERANFPAVLIEAINGNR